MVSLFFHIIRHATIHSLSTAKSATGQSAIGDGIVANREDDIICQL